MERLLFSMTVRDVGAGFIDYDASFDASMTPAEKQRVSDLVRRIVSASLGHDARVAGTASPLGVQ